MCSLSRARPVDSGSSNRRATVLVGETCKLVPKAKEDDAMPTWANVDDDEPDSWAAPPMASGGVLLVDL